MVVDMTSPNPTRMPYTSAAKVMAGMVTSRMRGWYMWQRKDSFAPLIDDVVVVRDSLCQYVFFGMLGFRVKMVVLSGERFSAMVADSGSSATPCSRQSL